MTRRSLALVDREAGELVQLNLHHATAETLAEFYAEHLSELEDLEMWLTVARKRMANHIRAQGPIKTSHGVIELHPISAGSVRLQRAPG